MGGNKYRQITGIPKEARQAYLARAEAFCEYPMRFEDGQPDPECRDYLHYVRCAEHEYCHCTGDTLILICERCWPKVLNRIGQRAYASQEPMELPDTPSPVRPRPPAPREREAPELMDTQGPYRPEPPAKE